MALKVETIIFLSLVLDLFAFTIPLPLFPRLIEWYTVVSRSGTIVNYYPIDQNGLKAGNFGPYRFLVTNTAVRFIREGYPLQANFAFEEMGRGSAGGINGVGVLSCVRTLQFLVSPKIGALSDKYGRKRVLLITMIGNMLSALVWIQSTSFASYMLSRVIGGLSEGNVQLAIAILSDVTTPANRSKALAHVGIAFAICFCIGPPIGAYFASRPLPPSINTWGPELNVYAAPAILTLVLLVFETIFLAFALPETRGKGPRVDPSKEAKTVTPATTGSPNGKTNDQDHKLLRKESVEKRLGLLKALRRLHFLFLGVFSGVEFTLTFLTFDLLDWNNRQNGMLIGSIGIISALLQGGYVRRATSKVGEGAMARRGVTSCAISLVLLALLPKFVSSNAIIAIRLLQGAAVGMAFTSATVVNSLTAFASLQCDEGGFDSDTGKPKQENPQLAKGKALGQFRSSGQLGRAIGPLLACASYWTFGPSYTYAISALAMFALSTSMKSIASTKSS